MGLFLDYSVYNVDSQAALRRMALGAQKRQTTSQSHKDGDLTIFRNRVVKILVFSSQSTYCPSLIATPTTRSHIHKHPKIWLNLRTLR